MDIQYLLFLQSLRLSSPGMTSFMRIMSELGAGTLAIIVAAVVYWCIHKKTGTHIFFSVAVGGLINQTFKNILCVNRPWVRDSRILPDEAALPKATGYSFPSGHSQMGASLYGSLVPNAKRKGLRVLAILPALLVGLSRNFLGVHTPQDVIVGLSIGALSVILSIRLVDWVEQKQGNDRKLVVIISAIAVFFLLFTSCKSYPLDYADGVLLVDPMEMIRDCYQIAGMLMGAALGWYGERKLVGFSTEVSLLTRILRGVLGAVGLILFSAVIKRFASALPSWPSGFVTPFFSFLYVAFLWPLLFSTAEKRINRKKSKHT